MGSKASPNNSVTNTDKRLSTGAGDIFALQDSSIAVSGGTLDLTVYDPKTALAALDFADKANIRTVDAVGALAKGSNEIAAAVAKSQEQFVATASGQKWAVGAIVALGAFLVLPVMIKSYKKGGG
jgi:hypothetical protein